MGLCQLPHQWYAYCCVNSSIQAFETHRTGYTLTPQEILICPDLEIVENPVDKVYFPQANNIQVYGLSSDLIENPPIRQDSFSGTPIPITSLTEGHTVKILAKLVAERTYAYEWKLRLEFSIIALLNVPITLPSAEDASNMGVTPTKRSKWATGLLESPSPGRKLRDAKKVKIDVKK